MSLKKTDLAKSMASKVTSRMKQDQIPGRYAGQASAAVDRREQRRLDAAAGLVPFACKLPAELVRRLNERAAGHDGGVNALLSELLGVGLAPSDSQGR